MSAYKDSTYDAIARYLTGEADAGEAATLEHMIAADSELKKLSALMTSSLARIESPSTVDVERALAIVRLRIAAERGKDRTAHASVDGVMSMDEARSRRLHMSRVYAVLAIAATVVVALGSVALWNARATRNSSDMAPLRYATSTGETRHFTLVDGTRVDLGPASRMTVAANFATDRSIELDGLARFAVTHDASHSFKVRAGNATVEDIGTVFSVRTDEMGGVAVTVSEGAVKLRGVNAAGDAGVVLHQGDRGAVADAAATLLPGAARPADVAWTSGRLIFENASLDRVRSDLRRWYGVEVVLGDSAVAARHLTAAFENEPFDQVMRVMGLALDAQVVRHGDSVYIGGHR